MTTRFASAAELMARVLGMPGYAFAVIDHPISSASDAELEARARATLEQVIGRMNEHDAAVSTLRAAGEVLKQRRHELQLMHVRRSEEGDRYSQRSSQIAAELEDICASAVPLGVESLIHPAWNFLDRKTLPDNSLGAS